MAGSRRVHAAPARPADPAVPLAAPELRPASGHPDGRARSRLRAPACARSCAVEDEQAGERAQCSNEDGEGRGTSGPPWPGNGVDAVDRLTIARRARQVLVLVVDAIDRARLSSQQRHAPRPLAACTRAAGSPQGECACLRPLARGRESPCGRASDRSPASLRDVPMCGGRDFTGWCLRSLPTAAAPLGQSRLRPPAAPADAPARAGRPCGTSPGSSRVGRRTRPAASAARSDRR